MLGAILRWTSIPSRGDPWGVVILPILSRISLSFLYRAERRLERGKCKVQGERSPVCPYFFPPVFPMSVSFLIFLFPFSLGSSFIFSPRFPYFFLFYLFSPFPILLNWKEPLRRRLEHLVALYATQTGVTRRTVGPWGPCATLLVFAFNALGVYWSSVLNVATKYRGRRRSKRHIVLFLFLQFNSEHFWFCFLYSSSNIMISIWPYKHIPSFKM